MLVYSKKVSIHTHVCAADVRLFGAEHSVSVMTSHGVLLYSRKCYKCHRSCCVASVVPNAVCTSYLKIFRFINSTGNFLSSTTVDNGEHDSSVFSAQEYSSIS